MILICYDGSADAEAAVDRAGQLMPNADATVFVIWETILEVMTRTGAIGMGFGMVGAFEDDGTEPVSFGERHRGIDLKSPPTSLPLPEIWTLS